MITDNINTFYISLCTLFDTNLYINTIAINTRCYICILNNQSICAENVFYFIHDSFRVTRRASFKKWLTMTRSYLQAHEFYVLRNPQKDILRQCSQWGRFVFCLIGGVYDVLTWHDILVPQRQRQKDTLRVCWRKRCWVLFLGYLIDTLIGIWQETRTGQNS